jgi:hypothetical protein
MTVNPLSAAVTENRTAETSTLPGIAMSKSRLFIRWCEPDTAPLIIGSRGSLAKPETAPALRATVMLHLSGWYRILGESQVRGGKITGERSGFFCISPVQQSALKYQCKKKVMGDLRAFLR